MMICCVEWYAVCYVDGSWDGMRYGMRDGMWYGM